MTPGEAELQSVAAIKGAVHAIDVWIRGEADNETFIDFLEREGPRVSIMAAVYVLGVTLDGLANGSFGMTRVQLWNELRPSLDRLLDDRAVVARLFADDDD